MDSFNFIIRDAVAADIDACLALDHSYKSDYVWRMVMNAMTNGYQINFRKERLPPSNDVARRRAHEQGAKQLMLKFLQKIIPQYDSYKIGVCISVDLMTNILEIRTYPSFSDNL